MQHLNEKTATNELKVRTEKRDKEYSFLKNEDEQMNCFAEIIAEILLMDIICDKHEQSTK